MFMSPLDASVELQELILFPLLELNAGCMLPYYLAG